MYRVIGYISFIFWAIGIKQGSWGFFSFETLIYIIFLGILIYISNAADGWEEWDDRFGR